MSVIIIGTGGGRATLRRIDAAPVGTFTAARAQKYNELLERLEKMADHDGCPPDPWPEDSP
jgi:hypothetical protein